MNKLVQENELNRRVVVCINIRVFFSFHFFKIILIVTVESLE